MDDPTNPAYPAPQLELDDSFRLVELQAGQKEDPIVVRILNSRLKDGPAYEALSYAWGDLSMTAPPIQVIGEDVTASTSLAVTFNCHQALKRLRRADGQRILWIDSICINQYHVPERNHQIKLIPRIYIGASRVVVYLGEGTTDTDIAMTCIAEIDSPSDFGTVPAYDDQPRVRRPDTNMIQRLFERRWFSRVWVLQEIRLAREAVVVCGDMTVNWDSFRAFRYWNPNTKWVEQLPYVVESSVFRLPRWSGEAMPSLLPYPKRLIKKLTASRKCDATDPRDKLYAILPLLDWEEQNIYRIRQKCSDADHNRGGLDLTVDYHLSPTHVFTQLARQLIDAVGLSLLSHVVSTTAMPGLPSWAPDWSANPVYTFRGQSRRVRRLEHNSDYFDDMTWDQNSFKAKVDDKKWYFSDYSSANGHSSTQLHIRAVHIGSIIEIGDICNVYENYFPLKQWESLIKESKQLEGENLDLLAPNASYEEKRSREIRTLAPFVRALAGDEIVYTSALERAVKKIRFYDGEKPKLKHAFSSCLNNSDSTEDEKPKIQLKDIFKGMAPSYEDQAEAIFYNCHGRRFFVTDKGHIGLAPAMTEVGEVVMAVEEAGLFVVRPVSQLDARDEGYMVKLLGEAYVQGISASEMWKVYSVQEMREFIIR